MKIILDDQYQNTDTSIHDHMPKSVSKWWPTRWTSFAVILDDPFHDHSTTKLPDIYFNGNFWTMALLWKISSIWRWLIWHASHKILMALASKISHKGLRWDFLLSTGIHYDCIHIHVFLGLINHKASIWMPQTQSAGSINASNTYGIKG